MNLSKILEELSNWKNSKPNHQTVKLEKQRQCYRCKHQIFPGTHAKKIEPSSTKGAKDLPAVALTIKHKCPICIKKTNGENTPDKILDDIPDLKQERAAHKL